MQESISAASSPLHFMTTVLDYNVERLIDALRYLIASQKLTKQL